MTILLNGERTEAPEGTTLAGVLRRLSVAPRRGVAVAVGGEVVPRAKWDARVLRDGERVEVVNAIQGG